MRDHIFLDKNSSDEYVQLLAQGAGVATTPLETWQYEHSQAPLVLRGILKQKIMQRCWQDHRWFWYMDSGYFGNRPNRANPMGYKWWHRVVPNDLQHNQMIKRPADRWQRHKINLRARQAGSRIVVAAPDDKPCKFYGIDLETWLKDTVTTLKRHTDRPIEVRQRPVSRVDRKTQTDWLQDVHAVVVFNSNAGTEAVINGLPVFVTAPCHAALPVANTDLTKIETPWFPDPDQQHAWACHLAYGQFHINELKDGTAARILTETKEILSA